MRKIAFGLFVGVVNLPVVFTGNAVASRQGLTGGLPLGDLAGVLPVLGETASVLPVAGGTGAGGLQQPG
jgi:hypothetical protein